MDDRHFDALTRALAQGSSRRTALKGLLGGLVGGIAVTSRLDQAGAQGQCQTSGDCLSDLCSVYDCVQGQCVLLNGCEAGETCCTSTPTCVGPGQCCDDFECDFSECEVCDSQTHICTSSCGSGEKCCDGSCIATGACCEAIDCGPPPLDSCSEYRCSRGACFLESICGDSSYCCDGACISNETCCTAENCHDLPMCCSSEAGNYCAQCCAASDCTAGTCGACFGGRCEYNECCYPDHPCPTACHICSTSGCINRCKQDEKCCGDQCIPKDACCSTDECQPCEVCTNGACDYPVSIPNGVCCGTPGNYYCAECCEDNHCGPCQVCSNGECIYPVSIPNGVCCGTPGNYYCAECCDDSYCADCDICVLGECVSECKSGERCCGINGDSYCAACCNDSHCPGDCMTCDDGVCRSSCVEGWVCCEDVCVLAGTCCQESGETCAVTSGPGTQGNCCADLLCCPTGSGGVCAECCEDTDCPDCMVCGENGTCAYLICELGYACCGGHECIPQDECCRHIGDYCGLTEVSSADGTPQYDCCDGLVCCDQWTSMGPVCAECCGDWDCPKGAWCHEGWCEWPDHCKDDKDCLKGTCCCKDGSCSGKCCDKPHPPKPPAPPKPAPAPTPAPAPVTTLPATGAGDSGDSSGLLGAAALGAAAALYAAKKMRETPQAKPEE